MSSQESSFRFAIVASRFNEVVTEGLKAGAIEFLREQGVDVRIEDCFVAPGAVEIPLIAKKLARTGRYRGVIGLGCVIKGDTAHFEFVSLAAAIGTIQAMLETEVPIAFGILTTYTQEQAEVRSRIGGGVAGPHLERNKKNEAIGNKGREAASACFEAAQTLELIAQLSN